MRRQLDDVQKRLDKNRHRSILVAKGGHYWVYTYLFAKKDRANITSAELKAFRELADLYERKTDAEIELELKAKELTEICHDHRYATHLPDGHHEPHAQPSAQR